VDSGYNQTNKHTNKQQGFNQSINQSIKQAKRNCGWMHERPAYLWLDGEGGKLLLAAVALAVVAWVDLDFDLCVEAGVDITRWVDASGWQRHIVVVRRCRVASSSWRGHVF